MTRIEQLRKIVDRHQYGKVEGHTVDVQTASMLVTVYDALSEENQERFEGINFLALVDFGWKHVKVGGFKRAEVTT